MFSSLNLKVSNILWLRYTLSDTPFRFTLKFYFILQISFWVHCFPELYFMRAKRVSAVIEAALDDMTSCKTLCSVLSHSHVMMWVLGCFVFFRRAGGWVILWVLQKRHSPDILSPVVGISVNYWYLLNLSWVIISSSCHQSFCSMKHLILWGEIWWLSLWMAVKAILLENILYLNILIFINLK